MSQLSVTDVLRERGLSGLIVAIIRRLRQLRVRNSPRRIHIKDVSRDIGGVDVMGYFTTEFGVGEAARTIVATLRTADIDVCTINYTGTESRSEHSFATDDESHHHVLICSINAEQLVAARNRLGGTFFSDRYVIGQWFWELEEAPSWYQSAWSMVDELWAPTRFIQTMLQKSAPSNVQIHYVPLPVRQTDVNVTVTRRHFHLDNRYMFLFVFDLLSIMKRKNPLGLIDAYTQGFDSDEGAQLVIKTMNGDKRPDDLALLLKAASERSDITVIDSYYSRSETSRLISLADCYVSLHRSEGLGLTLSEAMSYGVPVIATNYSGNTDFMNNRNSFLIGWDRTAVGEGAGGYNSTATWAEPRISDAVSAMQYVFQNQNEARVRGAQGRDDVLGDFSVERSGAIMKSRLEEIWSSLHGK